MIAHPAPRAFNAFDERMAAPRTRLVFSVLAQKRAEHPELWRAPTLDQLLAAAARERILVHDALLAPWIGAMVFRALGVTAITLNAAAPRAVRRLLLAHELGHAWCHVEDAVVMAWRSEEIGCWWNQPRIDGPLYARVEQEADLFACALLGIPLAPYRATLAGFFGQPGEQRAAA